MSEYKIIFQVPKNIFEKSNDSLSEILEKHDIKVLPEISFREDGKRVLFKIYVENDINILSNAIFNKISCSYFGVYKDGELDKSFHKKAEFELY